MSKQPCPIARVSAALSISLLLACSSGSDDDGGASGSGGSNDTTGGSNSGGAEASGGTASGGQSTGGDSGSGGSTDIPILDDVPDVEDKCADSEEDCIWIDGSYQGTPVSKFCEEPKVGKVQQRLLVVCDDEDADATVAFTPPSTGPFSIDLQTPEDKKQVYSLSTSPSEESLEMTTVGFAGAHCDATATPIDEFDGTLSGTCFGAWSEQGDGSYESTLSLSFHVNY